MTEIKRPEFFEKNAPSLNGIVVPEMAIFAKNNCKEGRWEIGETSYGSKLEIFILKFSRRISEYLDMRIPQGQIWFTPISGEIPPGILYYALLKNSKNGRSGSLRNFGQQVAICQSQGLDPREVIWSPKFIKKSGAIKNEQGILENAQWYVLDWVFRSVKTQEEAKILNNIVGIITNPEQMNLLFDPELENTSICVDGMNREEIISLLKTPVASVQDEQKVLAAAE